MQKDTLLKSTLILTSAAFVARGLGIFQRVPLNYLMNDLGNIYYNNANTIYLLLLTIATAGLPSAVSQMVSSRYTLGKRKEAYQVYQAALYFSIVAGGIVSTLLWIMAPFIANTTLMDFRASSAMRGIAFSLLLFPSIAVMRGYFQGRQFVTAVGVSQIAEQILRVITAVFLAYLFYSIDANDQERIAAAASFGSVFGSLAAFLIMVFYSRSLRNMDEREHLFHITDQAPLKWGSIYQELFRLSLPVVFTGMTVPLLYAIDNMMMIPLMVGYFQSDTIHHWAAIYGMNAQAIAGIPIVFSIALSQAIIPYISSSYALKDDRRVNTQAALALRMALYSGMPFVLLLGFGAYSFNGLLFKKATGSEIVMFLTLGTIFQIGTMLTNAILLSTQAPAKATWHAATGVLVKIILSLLTASLFGIYGIVFSTTFCFIWTFYLNFLSLRKRFNLTLLGRKWFPYLLTMGMTAMMIGFLQWGTLQLCASLPPKISFLVSCISVSLGTGLTYPFFLIFFEVIEVEEMASYPQLFRRALAPFIKLQKVVRVKSRK